MKVMLMVLGPNLMFFNMMNGQNCLSPGSPTTGLITLSTAEMNWNPIPGADGYELEYRVLNAPATVPWSNVTVATSTATLTGLTANTVYLAQVRTVCGSNFSDYTGKVVFSTAACIPASGLTASNITQTTADLNWIPVNGASGYKLLWRKLNSTQVPDPWNSDITGNYTLGITGLTESSLYETRILTDCGGTWSDTSNAVFFSTAGCSVPANLVVTGMNASSITVQWTSVPGGNLYNIDYRESGNPVWSTTNSNSNVKTIRGLTDNTQYEIRVRSRCGGNNFSDYTLPINGYTLPCGMPVNALVTAVSVDQATINWNNATGANNYRVDYRETGSPTWNTVNANNTTKKLNNLNPDTEYQVRVRSKCSGNQYSAYTDTLVFSTKPCGVPISLRIDSIGYHYVNFKWRRANYSTRYNFQYKKVGDTLWTQVNTNDTLKSLNNLEPNLSYIARVRSQCGNGGIYSDFSNEVYFGGYGCFTPINLTLDSTNYTTASIHWDFVSFATQYRIEYKPVQDSVWQTDQTQNTNIRLNQLTEGTTYQLRMRSRCPQNEFSGYSDTLVFSTKLCEVPLNTSYDSLSTNSVKLMWNSTQNAISYHLEYKLYNDVNWTERNVVDTTRWIYNLQKDSSYVFRVRAKYGNHIFSQYSDAVTFNTGFCGLPIYQSSQASGPQSRMITWLAGDNASSYLISYRAQGEQTWTVVTTNNLSYQLQNLDSLLSYELLLQGQCSFTGEYSIKPPIIILPPISSNPYGISPCVLQSVPATYTICSGSSVRICGIAEDIVPQLSRFVWSPAPISGSSGSCVTVRPTKTTSYTVSYTAFVDTDNMIRICRGSKEITVTIHPEPNLILTCPENVCNNSYNDLMLSCSDCPNNTTINIEINEPGGIIRSGIKSQDLGTNPFTFRSDKSETNNVVTIKASLKTAQGCTVTRQCSYTILDSPPEVDIKELATTQNPICTNNNTKLFESTFINGATYTWTINGNPAETIGNYPVNKFSACLNPGDIVCVKVSFENGCFKEACYTIPLTNKIIATLKREKCHPNRTEFCAEPLISGATYTWSICGTEAVGNCVTLDLDDLITLADPNCIVSCTITIEGQQPYVISTFLKNLNIIQPDFINCNFSLMDDFFRQYDVNVPGSPLGTLTPDDFKTKNLKVQTIRVINPRFSGNYIFKDLILDVRQYNDALEISSGASVKFDNCHIHGKSMVRCWKGFKISSNSDENVKIEFINSTLENAEIGVQNLAGGSGGREGTSEKVIIENSCFNENRVHIEINKLLSGNFTLTGSVLECLKPLKTNEKYANYTEVGLAINYCKDITVGDAYDYPATNANLFRNMQVGSVCNSSSPSFCDNKFQNLRYSNNSNFGGIYAIHYSTRLVNNISFIPYLGFGGDLDPPHTRPYNNEVELYNNDIGVFANAGIYAHGENTKIIFVGQNLFNSSNGFNELNSIPLGLNLMNVCNNKGEGFYYNTSVQKNKFNNLFSGVSITNDPSLVFLNQSRTSHNIGSTAYVNRFSNCRNGVFISNTNLNTPFYNVENNIFEIDNNTSLSGTIAVDAGRPLDLLNATNGQLAVNGNKISNYEVGIHFNGNFNFDGLPNSGPYILDNKITSQIPDRLISAIWLEKANYTDTKLNKIQGDVTPNFQSPDDLAQVDLGVGIKMQNTVAGVTLRCNYLSNLNHGIESIGTNMSLLRHNIFCSAGSGITLSNVGIIGDQGADKSSFFNGWNTNCNFGTLARRNSPGGSSPIYSSNQTSVPFVFNPGVLANNLGNGNDQGSTPINMGVNPFNEPIPGTSDCNENNWVRCKNNRTFNKREERLAYYGQEDKKMSNESRYLLNQALLFAMVLNPELSNNYILDSIFSLPKFENLRKSLSIDRLICQSPNEAITLLQGFIPENKLEDNQKMINQILLSQLLEKRSELTNAEKLVVVNIASLCPSKNGKSVHQARALRASWEGYSRFYTDNCSNENANENRNPQGSLKNSLEIVLSPNPAKDYVKVTIQADDVNVQMDIYSVNGIKVGSHYLKSNTSTEIPTFDLPSGIYLCKFSSHGELLNTHKLLINR